jgi:hypothetical protein
VRKQRRVPFRTRDRDKERKERSSLQLKIRLKRSRWAGQIQGLLVNSRGTRNLTELTMQLGGEIARVAHDDHAPGRIPPQKPGDIGDRDANRLERPRRLVNQQARGLAKEDARELMGDRLDMPVAEIGLARANCRKNLPDEEAQVSA